MTDRSQLREVLHRNTTHLAVCRGVVPYLSNPDPAIRAEAAAGIELTISQHPGGGDMMAAIRASAPRMIDLLDDISPEVRSAARSAVLVLARHASSAGQYADAARLFDAVLAHTESPEPLLWLERWECRVGLRLDSADEDLDAFRTATSGFDDEAMASTLAQDRHSPRDTDAWQAAALTRVAAHSLGDPGRARVMLEQSLALVKPRVDALLEQIAVGGPTPPGRYLPTETYGLLGLLTEREGDLDTARSMLVVAATLSPNGGLGAHLNPEPYRAWLHRLNSYKDAPCIPPDFDTAWLLDPERTPTDLQAAMASWAGVDWEAVPTMVDEALNTPLLALLLTELEKARNSHPLWSTPDASSLYARHLPLFERQFGHRYNQWESALAPSGGALNVVFDPLSRRPGDREAIAAAYESWLDVVRTGTTPREILAALPADAYDNLAIPLRLRGHFLDPAHFLADLVFAATNDAVVAASLVGLYGTLFQEKGLIPPAAWECKAEALGLPRSAALAQALFAYAEEAARRLYVAEHTPLPAFLDLKLLWPLAYVWDDSLAPKLDDFLNGSLDGKKKASPAMRAKREKTVAWILQRAGEL